MSKKTNRRNRSRSYPDHERVHVNGRRYSQVPTDPDARFFHGGPAGLTVGDYILPRSQLPKAAARRTADLDPADPNRVYISTDPLVAEAFAVSNSQDIAVSVYEVRVDNVTHLRIDSDYPTMQSFNAPRAQIAAVHVGNPTMTTSGRLEVLASGITWDDHTPMYSDDGYMQPSPQLLALGFVADDLRPLGRWPDRDTLTYDRRENKLVSLTGHVEKIAPTGDAGGNSVDR